MFTKPAAPARLDNHQLIQSLHKDNKQLRKELDALKNNVTMAAAGILTLSTAAAAIYLYHPTAFTDLATAVSTKASEGYAWAASFFKG